MRTADKEPNANQQAAIGWNEGPLLVLAGPGAGKTFVLTERVIRLIEESPESWFGVLALTFTNKAANEMRDRVGNRLGLEGQRIEVATFHSFCLETLRQHGSHIGLRTDFQLLTQEADRIAVLRDLQRGSGPFGASGLPIETQARVLGRLMRSGKAGAIPSGQAGKPLASGWKKEWVSAYVEHSIQANALDFDSLLVCCVRLFRQKPAAARLVRETYPFVCVDEYQDTNIAQDLLLRFLSPPPGGNLFVVADDDQILYEWIGASPKRLRRLCRDYDMDVIELPESFRCPQVVLDLANLLISRNQGRTPGKKPLRGVRVGGAERVRFKNFRDEAEEARWVAEDFQARRTRAAQCAVLARSGRLVREVYEAFQVQKIPVFHVERKSDFESSGVRFAAAAVRLAAFPGDATHLRRLCRTFHNATGVEVPVEDAVTHADMFGSSLLSGFLDAVTDHTSDSFPGRTLCDAIRQHLVERLDHHAFVSEASVLLASDAEGWTWSEEVREATIRETDRWREMHEEISATPGRELPLAQVLQELDLRSVADEAGPDQVRCMTIHQAKGKEFEHVYLVGLVEDELPSYYAKNNGESGPQIEEERRNCFVALTRASETLTLTYARSYFGRQREPSRFLAEMGLPKSQRPAGVRPQPAQPAPVPFGADRAERARPRLMAAAEDSDDGPF